MMEPEKPAGIRLLAMTLSVIGVVSLVFAGFLVIGGFQTSHSGGWFSGVGGGIQVIGIPFGFVGAGALIAAYWLLDDHDDT